MNKVARMSPDGRRELFTETAARLGLHPVLIEKDFWVCWALKQLFSIDVLRGNILFKGGTSLSKVFGVIKRFSEDIDLAVNYEPLGFTGTRDPATAMPKNRREKLLKEMLAACQSYIAGPFTACFDQRCREVLGADGPWRLTVRENDPNTLAFQYPAALDAALPYVTPAVLLELGTHAELIPSARYAIRPYAAAEFPHVFDDADCPVFAITAERTFWEKATILHAEFHRPPEKPMPPRYSRHYYDLAMLARTSVGSQAVVDLELLKRVVAHKQKFYASSWAHYELATPPTLRLVPPLGRQTQLKQDYRSMGVMLMGDPPSFESLLEALADLEVTINGGV